MSARVLVSLAFSVAGGCCWFSECPPPETPRANVCGVRTTAFPFALPQANANALHDQSAVFPPNLTPQDRADRCIQIWADEIDGGACASWATDFCASECSADADRQTCLANDGGRPNVILQCLRLAEPSFDQAVPACADLVLRNGDLALP